MTHVPAKPWYSVKARNLVDTGSGRYWKLSLAVDPPQQLTLRFTAVLGRDCFVEFSDRLEPDSPWQPLPVHRTTQHGGGFRHEAAALLSRSLCRRRPLINPRPAVPPAPLRFAIVFPFNRALLIGCNFGEPPRV